MRDVVYVAAAADAARLALHLAASRRMFPDGRFHVVVPDAEVPLFRAISEGAEVLAEGTLHPGVGALRGGWRKQQLVKLLLHRGIDAPALVLDADVCFARPTSPERFRDAPLYVEDPEGGVHPDWHVRTARFLGLPLPVPSIFPTPNCLHPRAARALVHWLEARHGQDIVTALHTRPTDWYEWALYGLFCLYILPDAPQPATVADHVDGLWTPDDWRAWRPDASCRALLVTQSLLHLPVREERARWARHPFLAGIDLPAGPFTVLHAGTSVRVSHPEGSFDGPTTRDHILLDAEREGGGWRLGRAWGEWAGAQLQPA